MRRNLLVLLLPTLLSCRHFTNRMDVAKYECGADAKTLIEAEKLVQIASKSGRLHKNDFDVKDLGEGESIYRITERGCLEMPASGRFLISSKDKKEFEIVDAETLNFGQIIKLRPAEASLPTMQCPSASAVKKNLKTSTFFKNQSQEDVPYITYKVSLIEPKETDLTRKSLTLTALNEQVLFEGLNDGLHKIRIASQDFLNEIENHIDCELTIDSKAPEVKADFVQYASDNRIHPQILLISRDQLIRFTPVGEQDRPENISIYYCFAPLPGEQPPTGNDENPNCGPENQKTAMINEPIIPPSNFGTWRLSYRASDTAGNFSNWAQPQILSYIDTNIQRTILDNAKPERLGFVWNRGLGLLDLAKQALSDFKLWNSSKTWIERELSRPGVLSSLYAAYIGLNLNGTVLAAASKIDKVLLTKDGKNLFAGGLDGSVYKFDVASGKIIGTIHEHFSGIGGMALNFDESRLVVAAFDHSTSIVDVDSFEVVKKIGCCTGEFPRVSAHPANNTFAISSWDKKIFIWDLDGNLIRTISKENSTDFHSDVIMSLSFSPDGKTLFSGAWDGLVKHWDVESGKFLKQNEMKHQDGINSMALFPSENIMASGAKDGSIFLHEFSTGKFLAKIETGSSVQALASTSSGTKLVAGLQDATIRTYEVPSGKETTQRNRVEAFNMGSVDVDLNGQIVVATTYSPLIRIWNASNTNSFVKTLRGHKENASIRSLLNGENPSFIYSGASDGKIIRWNLPEGVPATVNDAHRDTVYDLQPMKDGIVSFSKDGTIKWLPSDLSNVSVISESSLSEWKYSGAYIEADNAIVYGTWNGSLNRLDLSSNSEKVLNKSVGWVKTKFDRDLSALFVGLRSRLILELDSRTSKQISAFSAFPEAITGMAVDSKNRKIYASIYNGSIGIQALDAGARSYIKASNDILWDVTLGNQGKILVAAGNDGKVNLFDTASTLPLGLPIEAHAKAVRSVLVLQDQQSFVTASDDGTLKKWNLPITDDPLILKTKLCERIRPLAQEVWVTSEQEVSDAALCD